jgi:hypothetical protein
MSLECPSVLSSVPVSQLGDEVGQNLATLSNEVLVMKWLMCGFVDCLPQWKYCPGYGAGFITAKPAPSSYSPLPSVFQLPSSAKYSP